MKHIFSVHFIQGGRADDAKNQEVYHTWKKGKHNIFGKYGGRVESIK